MTLHAVGLQCRCICHNGLLGMIACGRPMQCTVARLRLVTGAVSCFPPEALDLLLLTHPSHLCRTLAESHLWTLTMMRPLQWQSWDPALG